MNRPPVNGARVWVLGGLATVTVVTGMVAFVSQGVPAAEAAYQTVALFFGPYSPPDEITSTWVLQVARAAGITTSLTAVLAIYIAVTGTSLRVWSRRVWGRLSRRSGHMVVLTDQPVAFTASNGQLIVQVTTQPLPGSQAVAGIHQMAAAAVKERALHAHVVLIAVESFSDAVHIATGIRDQARTRRHASPLILLQVSDPQHVSLLKQSALHDNDPLPVDAYLAADVYGAVVAHAVRSTGSNQVTVAAGTVTRERIEAVLRAHLLPTRIVHASTSNDGHGPLAVVWEGPHDTERVFTLSVSGHEPKWCVTGASNRDVAASLGYQVLVAHPGDLDGALQASGVAVMARHLHEHYLTIWPDSHLGPWDELTVTQRAENYAEAARVREVFRSLGYRISSGNADAPIWIPDAIVEQLAEREHEAWLRRKIDSGWVLGPRTDGTKQNPHLMEWSQLPDSVKQGNRDLVRAWAQLLTAAGDQLQPPD